MTCNALRFFLSGILLFFIQKILPLHWLHSMDGKEPEEEKIRKEDEENQLLNYHENLNENELNTYKIFLVLKNNSSLKWGIILGKLILYFRVF